jgi:hypothetical protein
VGGRLATRILGGQEYEVGGAVIHKSNRQGKIYYVGAIKKEFGLFGNINKYCYRYYQKITVLGPRALRIRWQAELCVHFTVTDSFLNLFFVE